MELNAEQIKKALECCTGDNDCNRCPYWMDVDVNCFDNVKSDALALITSQEQRIKELTEVNERLSSGNLVQLPCKVGQTVYVISQMRDKRILPFINSYEVTSIEVGKKKCVVYHKMDGYIKIIKQDDFGNTVFLTKEEAEKAIDQIAKEMLEDVK